MEKKVFRAWEDKRVLAFLIISAILIPFLTAFSMIVFVLEYYYIPLLLLLAILSLFFLVFCVPMFFLVLFSHVTFYNWGIEKKYFKTQIVSYNKIVEIKSFYKTIIIVEKNGHEEAINVSFFTIRTLINMLVYIDKKIAECGCKLENFDPKKLAKLTKISYKKALKLK